jgi:hypothetical protein
MGMKHSIPQTYDDQLQALEFQIDLADTQAKTAAQGAIRARWEFGRRVKAERDENGGKQLPNGRMAELVKLTGKSEREIRYRMQFADLHEESELGTLVQTFGTWDALRRSFTKSGGEAEPEAHTAKIERVFKSATRLADELVQIPDRELTDVQRDALVRYIEGIVVTYQEAKQYYGGASESAASDTPVADEGKPREDSRSEPDVFDRYRAGDCELNAGGDGGFRDVIKSVRAFIDSMTFVPTASELVELEGLRDYMTSKIKDAHERRAVAA